MSTYATPELLKAAIIETYGSLREYQSASRMAKRAFEEELHKTSQWRTYEQAKTAAADAHEKLKAMITNSPELTELQDDAKYNADAVQSAKNTLSGLLARQVMQSKNKSVDVGGEYPREVILKAVLGVEAPEQLPLFDE